MSVKKFFFLIFFFQRLFIFGTERDRAWMGEGQRERETQNRRQAPGSEPSAQSLMRGSNSWTVRSWPERSRTLNRLSHPGAPLCPILDKIFKGPKPFTIRTRCLVVAEVISMWQLKTKNEPTETDSGWLRYLLPALEDHPRTLFWESWSFLF